MDNGQAPRARARAAPDRGVADQSERETARENGIAKEHCHVEVLPDDVEEEPDAFK
jgi:hypothetical protein